VPPAESGPGRQRPADARRVNEDGALAGYGKLCAPVARLAPAGGRDVCGWIRT